MATPLPFTSGDVLTAANLNEAFKGRGCLLYRTSTQSINTATATVIQWTAEYFDTDGFHDNAVNPERITVPTGLGGLYLVVGHATISANSTGARQFYITPSGGSMGYGRNLVDAAASPTSTGLTFSAIGELSAGDYVTVNAYQDSGTTLNVLSGLDTVVGFYWLGDKA